MKKIVLRHKYCILLLKKRMHIILFQCRCTTLLPTNLETAERWKLLSVGRKQGMLFTHNKSYGTVL